MPMAGDRGFWRNGSAINTVRLKGKGQRGKVSNTSFTLYPLTFSQTLFGDLSDGAKLKYKKPRLN
jgi:hypothetical protein